MNKLLIVLAILVLAMLACGTENPCGDACGITAPRTDTEKTMIDFLMGDKEPAGLLGDAVVFLPLAFLRRKLADVRFTLHGVKFAAAFLMPLVFVVVFFSTLAVIMIVAVVDVSAAPAMRYTRVGDCLAHFSEDALHPVPDPYCRVVPADGGEVERKDKENTSVSIPVVVTVPSTSVVVVPTNTPSPIITVEPTNTPVVEVTKTPDPEPYFPTDKPATEQPGNPGNDKPVGNAGEHCHQNMCENPGGNDGEHGRSNND